MCTPECTSQTRQHPCMLAGKEGPAIHSCPSGGSPQWLSPTPRCSSCYLSPALWVHLSSSSVSFSMPLFLFLIFSLSASFSVAFRLPLHSQSLSASYLSSPTSPSVSLTLGPLSRSLSLSLSFRLSIFHIPFHLPLSSVSFHLSLTSFSSLHPVFPSFSLLPVESACQGFLETPTIKARAGKERHMPPPPLPILETLKFARAPVVADPSVPTLEARLFASTTAAVQNQPPGCHSYRSAHPFSRDCRSPTAGPAQERHHREGVSTRPGGAPRGALQGPPPMEGTDIPFPIPFPFQYWNLPRSSPLSFKIQDPPPTRSPSPQAALTLCGGLGRGRHAGPEQGAAGCGDREGAAAAAGSWTD